MAKKVVRTTCFDCHSKCGVLLTVEDNQIIGVEGDPNHPISEGMLCNKAFSAQEIHSHPERLKYPMKRVGPRGSGEWERITWDEAFDTIIDQMKKTIEVHGPKAIVTPQGTGRGSNHFHGRFQSTFGIPGFGLAPTHVCLLPNLAQTHITWGRMMHPHEAADYRNAGCIVVWGTNPVAARQYSGMRIMDGKRNGAKLIVVDPEFMDMASKADVHIPIRPGSDGALARCWSNLIVKDKKYNKATLTRWTNAPFLLTPMGDRLLRATDVKPNAMADDQPKFVVWNEKKKTVAIWDPKTEVFETEGVAPALEGEYVVTFADGSSGTCKTVFQTYAERLEKYTPEYVADVCWISKEKILKAYDLMMNNKSTLTAAYLGACMMNSNALQNGRAITCLQILLDPPIDENGGLHFNKFWEFMLDPKITLDIPDGKRKQRIGDDKYPMFTQLYGKSAVPNMAWDAIISGKPWPIEVMITIATDLLNCYENPQKCYDALMSPNLKLHVVQDYFMSDSAKVADIVLPAAHWTERVGCVDEELYPEPCPFVVPQKATEPPGEAQDDWFTYRELGKRLDPEKWPWNSSEEMQLWRLKEFHGVDVTWDVAAKHCYIQFGGEHRVSKKHEKGLVKFRTPSMRIEIYSEPFAVYGYDPLPEYYEPGESPYSEPGKFKEYPLVLTTGARDYPFYHSAWTNIAKQRILEPYPYVKMNEKDAEEMGISDGEWVYVESPRGRVEAKAKVGKGLRKGVVSMPRQTYKHACEELNLPGYGWDKANPNILIPAEPADPGFSASPMRGTLCRVVKK